MLRDRTHVSIKVKSGRLFVLDQTLLPSKEVWLDVTKPQDLCTAIVKLSVRGAPLIGVSAALSLAIYSSNPNGVGFDGSLSNEDFLRVRDMLISTRPTAVNLQNAMRRMSQCMGLNLCDKKSREMTLRSINQREIETLIKTANDIIDEDVDLCEKIGIHGANFIKSGDNIVTHCNTGSLATAGVGTALGAIITAFKDQRKDIHV